MYISNHYLLTYFPSFLESKVTEPIWYNLDRCTILKSVQFGSVYNLDKLLGLKWIIGLIWTSRTNMHNRANMDN